MTKMLCGRRAEIALQELRQARDQIGRFCGSDIRVSTMAKLAGYTGNWFSFTQRHDMS